MIRMSDVDDAIERAEVDQAYVAALPYVTVTASRDWQDRLILAAEVDRLRAQVAAVEEACGRMVLDWHYTGEPTGPHLADAAAMIRAALASGDEACQSNPREPYLLGNKGGIDEAEEPDDA